MLPGITVLNEYTHITSQGGSSIFLGIILIIGAIAILGFAIQDSMENKKVGLCNFIIILVCIAVLVGAIMLIISGINWQETIYEVTISDDASPVQLLENYEIRSKEGLIYKIVPYSQD